jgi:serine/threonine-protein kinase
MDEEKTEVARDRDEDTRRAGGTARFEPAPSTIASGTLLVNTYRIERLLGAGGMGEVYLARHVGLGTQHAVKVIRPALFENRQILDLFRREASVLRGVRHDAVVSYDGFFRDAEGRDYLVMEFAGGPSLSDRVRKGPLTIVETLALRDRLAEGLSEAHRKGAVHRDISPDNVILPNGQLEDAKLIDFGLCKLTDPTQQTIIGSAFAGKYRFASPEQLGLFGGQVDARSDIYSLGLVLVAAAVGRPVDMGSSFESVVQARRAVPDLQAVPAVLRDQFTAMLQPDPEDRPQTLAELLQRWPASRVLPGTVSPRRGPTARAPGASPSGTRVRRRVPGLALASAALAVALAAGSGYWLVRVLWPPAQEAPQGGQQAAPKAVAYTPDALAGLPWDEARPYFQDWLARGRLDDAFELLRSRVGAGRALPKEETYRFAQELTERGRLSDAFALLQVIARDGYAPAALAVGEMYDPVLWTSATSPFGRPNPRKAEGWYRTALERGAQGAGGRLEAMRAWQRDQGVANDEAR